MSTRIEFRVDGIPKGQPRPRAFAMRTATGCRARMYDAGTAEGWKGLIALAAKPHLPAAPITEAVTLSATFYMPRPKCLMRKKDPEGELIHTAKPDLDNLVKAVKDALTQVGMWHDDAQVSDYGQVRKRYHAKSGRPGAVVVIEV